MRRTARLSRSSRARRSTSTACRSSKKWTARINHFKNFIRASWARSSRSLRRRSGSRPPFRGHMATLSFKNQKKVIWDDTAQEVPLRLAPFRMAAIATSARAARRGAFVTMDHRPGCRSLAGDRQRGWRAMSTCCCSPRCTCRFPACGGSGRSVSTAPISSPRPRARSSIARRACAHRKLFFGSLAVFFSLGPLMVLAGLKGWLLPAGGCVGLLSRHPAALRIHGAVQGQESRPGSAGQHVRPHLPRCDDDRSRRSTASSFIIRKSLGITSHFPVSERPCGSSWRRRG